MYIDTTSRNGMEESLAHLTGVSIPELYRFIEDEAYSATKEHSWFDMQRFLESMKNFFTQRVDQALPDEILLFHLSRRLNGSEREDGINLSKLLTTNNSFTEFLNAYKIAFRNGAGNKIILLYKDKQFSFDESESTDLKESQKSHVPYLRRRLGYISGLEDFCINGFAFRDLLMKNHYARDLSVCPELLQCVVSFLSPEGLAEDLKNDYMKKSNYYCFTYKLPLDRVLFDGEEILDVVGKRLDLLTKVAYRLYQYTGESRYLSDEDNPILRLNDDDIAPVDCLLSAEIITPDMIEW